VAIFIICYALNLVYWELKLEFAKLAPPAWVRSESFGLWERCFCKSSFPLAHNECWAKTPTISHYGPKNNSFYVSTSAQSKGTWTASHYAILSNKNEFFSHYFFYSWWCNIKKNREISRIYLCPRKWPNMRVLIIIYENEFIISS
jgi:hypothetical protein